MSCKPVTFIYLFLAVLGFHCCACRLSLVAASRGYSSLCCVGFSLWWFSCCRAWALGTWASVVVAHGLSSGMGLVAQQHVESSWQGSNLCSCIGRWILNQQTTREFQYTLFFLKFIYLFGCARSQLRHMGSLIFVVACGILVATCEIQFPDQGLNLAPCTGSTKSQPLDHLESAPCSFQYSFPLWYIPGH